MNVTFKPWGRRLAWALPMFALLAGCDAGKDAGKEAAQEPTKPHAVATYVSAPWEALPSVSDSDLLAGFESWRSACQRLKADPIWGPTCAAATSVPGDAVAVRGFLKEHLDVFGLRSADNTPNG
ncbi:MAG: transglycosylase, partial [Pseudomonas paracarnis]